MDKRTSLFFVFSAPSGAGKTSLIRGLCEKDATLHFSVSVTTRPQRPLEKEGVDYSFVSKEIFEEKIKNNAFIEYAKVFDYYYGTPSHDIAALEEKEKDLVVDMDFQGAAQVRAKYSGRVVSIFILPPSLIELEARLRKRGQDCCDVITNRLKKAVQEIRHWKDYDYVIVNKSLDDSIEQARCIIQSERLSVMRNSSFVCFVGHLINPTDF